MPRRSTLAIALAASAAAVVVPFAVPAGAQDTTNVYVVHGLNLADQTAQIDGGSNVTVCADGEDLIDDVQFGQVVGPIGFETGVEASLSVYEGAGVDCAAPGGAVELVASAFTLQGDAAAVVITSLGDDSALVLGELDVSCTEPGEGRHAVLQTSGDTGEVDVLVDGESVGTASFPDGVVADVPAGTYSVEVTEADAAIVGPLDQVVDPQQLELMFIVGNVDGDSPIVPLFHDIEVELCVSPTTTTTVPVPTTVVPGVPVEPTSRAAAPIAFTG